MPASSYRPESSTPAVTLADWKQALDTIDYAFQPIVTTQTGRIYGYEALLRNWAEAGFHSIQDVFDTAWRCGCLHQIDTLLRRQAINKFADLPHAGQLKLFYNFDSRTTDTPDYQPGRTLRLLAEAGLAQDTICLEVSERQDMTLAHHGVDILSRYRDQGFMVALDDYGNGFSQLRALYDCQPDIIKIDRFFIDGISQDRRKELFVGQTISFAHLIGARVVAEGIETPEEFSACRRLGCDMVQGYFVGRPSVALPDHSDTTVAHIARLISSHHRSRDPDRELVRSFMLETPPIPNTVAAKDFLAFIKQNNDISLYPVVNHRDEPIGVIRDADLKAFVYAPFGRELLQNPHNPDYLARFLRRCPSADIDTSLSELLETFVISDSLDGLILTEHGHYLGILDQQALLRAISERNTLNARDENPLTRLPGNAAIYSHTDHALAQPLDRRIAVYFDFDHFKPFNDHYGFRQGDRAILLFKDILGKALSRQTWFVGHIGGDDFFAYAASIDYADAVTAVRKAQADFDAQIKSFYDAETRARGYIQATKRDGHNCRFGLMTVSAAIVRIPCRRTDITLDEISHRAAHLKALAKNDPRRFAAGDYCDKKNAPPATRAQTDTAQAAY
ncbi:GGDEF domain-containing protein [Salinisphaera sp. Q1T1-3]|nr:GGDEF domain-containing protein [Salinisphaera sp. Q1T1-3]